MNRYIIRAIGSLTDNWQKMGQNMYTTRLSTLSPVNIIELPEGHGGAVKPNIEKTRTTEAKSLLKGIDREAFVIALDETGKSLASEAFAHSLAGWSANGRPVVFLIGGSWGLDDEAKARANFTLSLGAMTLPHSLARIVLLEQLYRAAMIQSGRAYHK